MSPKVKTYCQILVLFFASLNAIAQNFTDQGMMSGTGVVFLPSPSLAPSAQFRVQAARMQYLKKDMRGFNLFELNGGFSPNLEGYIKLFSEQTGTIASTTSYGIGGKFQIPIRIPLVENIAIWSESVSSNKIDSLSTLPLNIIRGGMSASFRFWKLQPSLFAGAEVVRRQIKPLGGIGILFPVSSSVKFGSEVAYNYFYRDDILYLITGTTRLISNIGLQLSTGYTTSTHLKSWIVTVGLCLSTSNIDFTPKAPPKQQLTVPSIEEIEKLSSQEKGVGQNLTDPMSGKVENNDDKKNNQSEENKGEKKEDPKK